MPELAELATALGVGECDGQDEDPAGGQAAKADAAVTAVAELLASVGIPADLAALGAPADRLPWAAAEAMTARRLVDNNPRPLDEAGGPGPADGQLTPVTVRPRPPVGAAHNDETERGNAVSEEIVKLFEGLRVADVRDGLDWIGMPNKGSVDRSIMPIAEGMKFCGPAFTVRSRVTQKQVPMISGEEYTTWARDYWYKEVQIQPWDAELSPGDIVVLESPDAGCGEIGSYNSLDMHIKGAAAIVTSGGARDHDECVMQGVPIFAAHRNQAMTQGRVEYETYGVPVTIGGVQIKPGDIVVGDGDGVIAVPLEVAEEVAKYARQENENDKRGRRALYEKAGLPLDDSVR